MPSFALTEHEIAVWLSVYSILLGVNSAFHKKKKILVTGSLASL